MRILIPVLLLALFVGIPRAFATFEQGEALQLDQNGSTSTVHIDFQEGRKLIIFHDPLCGPCIKAFKEMPADLMSTIQSQGILLMAFRYSDSLVLANKFNHEHPGLNTLVVVHPAAWPGLDLKSTPTFFVLDQGRVTCELKGWGQSVAEKLRKCLGSN